jgi:hypothetical protein
VALGLQLNSWFGFQRALAILGEQATLAAAGTTQGTATAITTANAIVSTVAAGTGVVLPSTPAVAAKDRIHVANNGANTLAVYPPAGGKLGSAAVNVPALMAPGKCADFYCVDGTNYTALLSA